jgi:hypothetical protein
MFILDAIHSFILLITPPSNTFDSIIHPDNSSIKNCCDAGRLAVLLYSSQILEQVFTAVPLVWAQRLVVWNYMVQVFLRGKVIP